MPKQRKSLVSLTLPRRNGKVSWTCKYLVGSTFWDEQWEVFLGHILDRQEYVSVELSEAQNNLRQEITSYNLS